MQAFTGRPALINPDWNSFCWTGTAFAGLELLTFAAGTDVSSSG